ncbi:hypothetical protein FQR65_LT09626 [Abscondita terminalis]|nr:hypothetical protein FQR65_LT09626 [Abscondita terminalis]
MENENVKEEIIDIKEEVINEAAINLLPEKSRRLYEASYESFKKWCAENDVKNIDENTMLTYFDEKSKTFKSSTLWAQYSMIKSCMALHENIDVSQYKKLISFLKRNSDGYTAKKSKIFNREQVNSYLSKADDDVHLMRKVALIIGVAGACRADELINLSVDNINDLGSSLRIRFPHAQKKVSRTFVITSREGEIDVLDLYRKYARLRPNKTNHRRFFIFYKDGKCTVQPVGKNTMGKVPNVIAKWLKLPNPERYTAHCFRRSSATVLADADIDISTNLKW